MKLGLLFLGDLETMFLKTQFLLNKTQETETEIFLWFLNLSLLFMVDLVDIHMYPKLNSNFVFDETFTYSYTFCVQTRFLPRTLPEETHKQSVSNTQRI